CLCKDNLTIKNIFIYQKIDGVYQKATNIIVDKKLRINDNINSNFFHGGKLTIRLKETETNSPITFLLDDEKKTEIKWAIHPVKNEIAIIGCKKEITLLPEFLSKLNNGRV